tara:strand:- start:759 stop:1763 length:1005 start_codon:yes stop_codon:yes gene_type:complete
MNVISAIYLNKDKDLFWSKIDELSRCITSLDSRYIKYNFEYYEQRSCDELNEHSNRSFILLSGNKPFFAFIGSLVTKRNNSKCLCVFERPCGIFEKSNISKIEKKAIRIYLEKLLKDKNFKCRFRVEMNVKELSSSAAYLIFLNQFQINPEYCFFIDLKHELSEIKSNLRKRYKQYINFGLRELNIKIFTSKNITWNEFEEFMKLHIKESGRQTRSQKTWERQYQSVKNDQAFLIKADLYGKSVSFGLFFYSKNHCDYSVSVSRRELFDKPIFHSLMWSAIVHAKKLNIDSFELGPCYPLKAINYEPTNKEISIAKFKGGFGGQIRLNFELTDL